MLDEDATAALIAPLPAISTLVAALPTIQQPSHDPALKIVWCRDVIFLVDRLHQQSTGSPDALQVGPVTITDPQLQYLAQVAVTLILQIASYQQTPIPPYVAEAIYYQATLAASGAYPDQIPFNPRSAFKDFEASARAGYAPAWFRIGRDYENFNDPEHAKECFERGIRLGVESCCYRMGMAHLLGQLSLPSSPERALPLLHTAAINSTVRVPQPAYVFALLLLSSFPALTVPLHLFTQYIPPSSNAQLQARMHLERSAYLHFAPAQYKLGHCFEYAVPPFPFDALLSVQWYSLSSQQGEVEADMALSKWFLCGAEGVFEKDENLAWMFADKAARRGLPSAEFAMGYYAEVGVGCERDLEGARRWYEMAAEHGNTDAADRLLILSEPAPHSLSRLEHDKITDNKLVRKRTQARQRSDQQNSNPNPEISSQPPQSKTEDPQKVIEIIRKRSLAERERLGQDRQNYVLSPVSERSPPLSPPQPQFAVATPRPQKEQQFPARHRYTLVDPGSNSAPPPPSQPVRTQSPAQVAPVSFRPQSPGGRKSPARAAARRSVAPASSLPNVVAVNPGPEEGGGKAHPERSATGPTTFAEMGFTSTKVKEEKDCVVM